MRIPTRLFLIAATLLLGSCAAMRPTTAGQLEKLVESYFDDYLALNPTDATDPGDHR